MPRWFLISLAVAWAAASCAMPILIEDGSGARHIDPLSIDHDSVLVSPELLEFVAPVVPDTLWGALADTTLMLLLYVNYEGGVDSTAYLEGEPLLAGPASEAALEWKFEPARTVDSIAVEVHIAVPFRFCPSCPERSLVHSPGLWEKLRRAESAQE